MSLGDSITMKPRHKTVAVDVGGVAVGGGAPVVVQSMTNTDTADIASTVKQVADLARAGSELVRITVDRDEAAKAVPHIRDQLRKRGVNVPLIGDFHYIGHKLLARIPPVPRRSTSTASIPATSASRTRRIASSAPSSKRRCSHGKPVRIGVNWGSLDAELLTHLMDENAKSADPKSARAVMHEAMVQSALLSAERAEEMGLRGPHHCVRQGFRCAGPDRRLSDPRARSRYALHLGLTEAGMGSKGIVASSVAIGILLQHGIGDTIRFSLTPEPGGDRTQEVCAAQEILQTMGLRSFVPVVAACPGCGRTTSTVFQELARDIQDMIRDRMPDWKTSIRGRDTEFRRHGLHRERSRREQACRYRHIAARHRRIARCARIHRRQKGDDAPRPEYRCRFKSSSRTTSNGVLPAPRRWRAAARRSKPQAVESLNFRFQIRQLMQLNEVA